jgi:malonyl-CoA O-methyltransferase
MSGPQERARPAAHHRFSHAAPTYEKAARAQRHTAERLGRIIAGLPLPADGRILEIGCGTGFLTRALARDWPQAEIVAGDLAEAMTRLCRDRLAGAGARVRVQFAVFDGENPPFVEPFDLVTGSLVVQWFRAPEAAFARVRRLVSPRGFLAFATLAPGSFVEWETLLNAHGLAPRLRPLVEGSCFEALVPEGGSLSLSEEILRITYENAAAFLDALRRIGANEAWTAVPAASFRERRKILAAIRNTGPFMATHRLLFAVAAGPEAKLPENGGAGPDGRRVATEVPGS